MLNFIDYNSENKYESGIYCITNIIDNRIYIGSTQCFKRRFSEHSRSFSDNTHNNPHLHKFVNKYGIDSIKFYIVQMILIKTLISVKLQELLLIIIDNLQKKILNISLNCIIQVCLVAKFQSYYLIIEIKEK